MLTAAQRAYISHLVSVDYDTNQKLKPAMSNREFAKTIGVHYNSLVNWQKLPEFQEQLKRAKEEFSTGKDYFSLVMRQRAHEELVMQYEKASGSEKRQYLRMILDETKHVEDYIELPKYQDKTDKELAELILADSSLRDDPRLAEIAQKVGA